MSDYFGSVGKIKPDVKYFSCQMVPSNACSDLKSWIQYDFQ